MALDGNFIRLGAFDGVVPTNKQEAEAAFRNLMVTEILAAFEKATVFKDRHTVKKINSGMGAYFYRTGNVQSDYHVPGGEVKTTNLPFKKVTINADHFLHATAPVDQWEKAVAELNIDPILSKEMGQALAYRMDNRIARILIKGARSSGTIQGDNPSPGGSRIIAAQSKTEIEALMESLIEAATALDDKDVAPEGRYCALPPILYRKLAAHKDVQNADLGGGANMPSLKVSYWAGFEILMTNNLPKTNITTSLAGERNDYSGDFSTTTAICWHKNAAATVLLSDLRFLKTGEDTELKEFQEAQQARMACGHGLLRPECCVEIATA